MALRWAAGELSLRKQQEPRAPTPKQVEELLAVVERLPPSARATVEAELKPPYYLLRPGAAELLLLGTSPFCRIRAAQGCEDCDWFWRISERLGGFPLFERRAFLDDPPAYDASFLVGCVCASLLEGRAVYYEDELSLSAFATLLKFGPTDWRRDVLAEARWMPRSRSVLASEAGLRLLLRIAPLRLRRQLGLPGDDAAEDLLMLHETSVGSCWCSQPYGSSEGAIGADGFMRLLGVSKRRRRLIMIQYPEYFVDGCLMPGGDFLERRAPVARAAAPVQPPAEALMPPPPPPAPPAPESGVADDLDEKVRLDNELARQERRARRAGGARAEPPPPPGQGPVAGGVERPLRAPPVVVTRRRARAEAAEQRARGRLAARSRAETEAFLRQCRPALEAAKVAGPDPVLHEDAVPELERKLARELKTARQRQKRQQRAEAAQERRARVQRLVEEGGGGGVEARGVC
jgi:hypothetical protein